VYWQALEARTTIIREVVMQKIMKMYLVGPKDYSELVIID
jgi:hypothetical protein